MKDQSGNALWFVLLAIALLAALSVTISRTTDSTEQNADFERYRIQVSQILRFSTGLEKTAEQLRLRGISENDISFEDSQLDAAYGGSPCAVDDCRLFHVGGGGQSYAIPSDTVNNGDDWIFSGANDIQGVGTTAADLIMILPEVTQVICTAINTELGIAGIPADTGRLNLTALYQGVFQPAPETIDAAPGKRAGCLEGALDQDDTDISGQYYFYHVLIPR